MATSGERKIRNVRVPSAIFVMALQLYNEELHDADSYTDNSLNNNFTVYRDGETWTHDDLDDFIVEYDRPWTNIHFTVGSLWGTNEVAIECDTQDVTIRVDGPGRAVTQRVLRKLVQSADVLDNRIAAPTEPSPDPKPPTKIFLGHGQAPDWKDLHFNLTQQHGLDVVSFESGARTGHAIRDVVTGILDSAHFAILMFTAEDQQADETMRARQNVVHEAGLFQGRLGYRRAIMLFEDGVEGFSNVQGILHLRFEKGKSTAVVGEILAALRNEGLLQ